jgi:hypothetical protein
MPNEGNSIRHRILRDQLRISAAGFAVLALGLVMGGIFLWLNQPVWTGVSVIAGFVLARVLAVWSAGL